MHITKDVIEYALYDSLSQNTSPVKSFDKVMKKISGYIENEWKKTRSESLFPVLKQCLVYFFSSLFAHSHEQD
jgi:hypothetical protein